MRFLVALAVAIALAATGLPAQERFVPVSSLRTRSPELRDSGVTDREHAAMSSTGTGVLVGGVIGLSAAAFFLTVFCSDGDTQCGADEFLRAVVVFAVPPAVVGGVIGALAGSL